MCILHCSIICRRPFKLLPLNPENVFMYIILSYCARSQIIRIMHFITLQYYYAETFYVFTVETLGMYVCMYYACMEVCMHVSKYE